MKYHALAGALAATLALAACSEEPAAPVEEEGTIPGITIENARMVLGPVQGNPAAVYFDLKYDGARGLSLNKAAVANTSSAVLHDYGEWEYKVQMMEVMPIALQDGTEVEFKPGGLHVMAFDPSPELQPGGTAEVTLTVIGGKTHTFEAEILAAGDERAQGNGDAN